MWTAAISPERVAAWSPQEAKAVLVAWAAVERSSKHAGAARPDIMEFRVKGVPSGWEVYVQFVGGYDEGKPLPMPGNFCVVQIGPDWKVIRIVGGA